MLLCQVLPPLTWIKVDKEVPVAPTAVSTEAPRGEAPGPRLLSCGGKPHKLEEGCPLGLIPGWGIPPLLSPLQGPLTLQLPPQGPEGTQMAQLLFSGALPHPVLGCFPIMPFSPPTPPAHPNLARRNADSLGVPSGRLGTRKPGLQTQVCHQLEGLAPSLGLSFPICKLRSQSSAFQISF